MCVCVCVLIVYLHAQAKCCKGKLIFKKKVKVCLRELMTHAFTLRLAHTIRPKASAHILFIIHISYWSNHSMCQHTRVHTRAFPQLTQTHLGRLAAAKSNVTCATITILAGRRTRKKWRFSCKRVKRTSTATVQDTQIERCCFSCSNEVVDCGLCGRCCRYLSI